jgi:Flp pilus assembly protein TadG
MKAKTDATKRFGFLSRLRKDEGGNVVAIVAAALVPLAAMIGGGIDMSRSYMVKTRLQQACDAGVLAGRKAVGEGTFDTAAEARAEQFFASNFPTGYQDTQDTTFDANGINGGTTVQGVATTKVPTLIMDMFGKDSFDLEVSCDAKLEVSNADIMMVLDTTGSMTAAISDGNGGTTTRILALRGAMTDFYDVLTAAADGTTARIRYGFVPYSGTVNVGGVLMAENSTYVTGGSSGESANYQSRRAVYKVYGAPSTGVETLDFVFSGTTYAAYATSSECTKYQNNQNAAVRYFRSGSWRNGSWTPASDGYSGTGNPLETATNKYTFSSNSWTTPNGESTTYKTCKRNRESRSVTLTFDGTASGAVHSHYEYSNLSVPVSNYVATLSGGTVTDPSDSLHDAVNPPNQVSWSGCIQERTTTASATFAYDNTIGVKRIIPTAATDLDIDAVPTDAASRWTPYWPQIVYYRSSDATSTSGTASQTACPWTAQLLAEMDEDEFDEYAGNLTPNGGTYHDIGLIWGARLASPDGIFADNVTEDAANGSSVGRHLIFMTDGQIDTGETYYSAYGVERHDKRITGTASTERTLRHERRFAAMCDAIKAKGIRVWVIAFSTSLSTELTNCASGGLDSAFTSTNASGLRNTFVTIAQSISDLRLSK